MAQRDPLPQKPKDRKGESFAAWEDKHWVNADSPEVGWYLHPDGTWKLDPISGRICINPDYFDRAVAASWGLGDGAIEGLVSGLGKGGDMFSMFMGGATSEINATTKQLRQEIIIARNAWCQRHGIPIPSSAGAQQGFGDWMAERLGKPDVSFIDALKNLFKK